MSARTSVAARLTTALRHPVVIVGLLAVALQLVFRGWALSSSWFYTDDFILLRDARASGLTLEYLARPENGHVLPATRAIFFWLAQGPELNWGLAITVSLALQLVTSLAALWMLVVLFGTRWGVIPLMLLYLSSAMTAQASLWWVSSLNQTPVQATFFLATGWWVLYLRTRRPWALIATVGAIGGGLLFFQKALLVLPLLGLLALFYFASGSAVARLRTVLVRYWPAAVALGLLGIVVTLDYLARVPTREDTSALAVDWNRLVVGMALRALPAGVSGGPWEWEPRDGGSWADPPGWFLALSWLLVVAVVLGSVLWRRRAGRAWLLVMTHYAMLILAVGVSRAAVFGSEIGTAYRLQTEGLAVIVIALGLAWLPLLGAEESSEPRASATLLPWPPSFLVVPVTLAVTVTGTISWVRYLDQWHSINDSRPFAEGLMAQDLRLPGLDLVDREVPGSVLTGLLRPDNRLSDIATLLAPSARFPADSGRMAVVTDSGDVHRASIDPVARSAAGPVAGCGWAAQPGKPLKVPMQAPAPFGELWLRIPYFIGDDGEVTIDVAGESRRVTVDAGVHDLFLRIEDSVDGVRFSNLTTQGALCMNRIELGEPVPGPKL